MRAPMGRHELEFVSPLRGFRSLFGIASRACALAYFCHRCADSLSDRLTNGRHYSQRRSTHGACVSTAIFRRKVLVEWKRLHNRGVYFLIFFIEQRFARVDSYL